MCVKDPDNNVDCVVSPPISIVQMEKIFSESVLADTFPKPTLVRLLRAKYSEVT